jgi:hypothetical protein
MSSRLIGYAAACDVGEDAWPFNFRPERVRTMSSAEVRCAGLVPVVSEHRERPGAQSFVRVLLVDETTRTTICSDW